MELDEFKTLLRQKSMPELPSHSSDELGGYIRMRAGSVIQKVKQSIRFELVACAMFALGAGWAWFAYPVSYVRAFALLSCCFSFFLLLYLVNLQSKISVVEKGTLAVREGLQASISILEQFTRAYFQFTMISLPIAFIFGLLTGFRHITTDAGMLHFNWNRAILFYAIGFVSWSVLMYFFSKWYIKKLYGNYLLQLKDQLKDIENG